jgi:hypothetical protein
MLVERRGQVTDVGSEPTGNGRSFKILDGRRQPSCGGTSRMMREYHVRICESCALKARRTQPSEMAAAAKPSEQPRTKSCVAFGNDRCEA